MTDASNYLLHQVDKIQDVLMQRRAELARINKLVETTISSCRQNQALQDHAESIAFATSQRLLQQSQKVKESNLALLALKSGIQNILRPQQAERTSESSENTQSLMVIEARHEQDYMTLIARRAKREAHALTCMEKACLQSEDVQVTVQKALADLQCQASSLDQSLANMRVELLGKQHSLEEARSKMDAVQRRQMTLQSLQARRKELKASIAEKEKNVALMMKTHAAQQARLVELSKESAEEKARISTLLFRISKVSEAIASLC